MKGEDESSLTVKCPSSLRRCWSTGGGQLWRSSSPLAQSRGEAGPSEEEGVATLYSSMSRMEASRAAWSSCSCSFNSRRMKQHGGPTESRRCQVIQHEYIKTSYKQTGPGSAQSAQRCDVIEHYEPS